MVRTSISPAAGSGAGVSSIRKSASDGNPSGRAFSRIRRFVRVGMRYIVPSMPIGWQTRAGPGGPARTL